MGNQSSSDGNVRYGEQQEGHPLGFVTGSRDRGGHHQYNSSSNQNHHHGNSIPIRNLLSRSTGAAGLSKSELDRRCQPSGLYPTCQWEDKAIRRLIGDGKLAARMKGAETRQHSGDYECPICFLNYSEINTTKCCQAFLCTECFLQVRPQREVKNKPSTCPFCNSTKLAVTVAKKLDNQAIQDREQDEQLVIEAKIRERAHLVQEGLLENNNKTKSVSISTNEAAADTPVISKNDVVDVDNDNFDTKSSGHQSSTPAFGASLEQNQRVALMRARSSSVASSNHGKSEEMEVGVHEIAAIAMTPEERKAIEQEMKAQHNHPLAQRLQAEEEERRLHNEREYYRSQRGRLRELRARRELISRTLGSGSGGPGSTDPASSFGSSALAMGRISGREWTRVIEAFENSASNNSNTNSSSGGPTSQPLDDLVVLEAAIMLSMEEEARNRAGSNNQNSSTNDEDGAAGLSHPRDRVAQLLRTVSPSSSGLNDPPNVNNNSLSTMVSRTQSTSRDLRSRRRRGGDGDGRFYFQHHPALTNMFSSVASDTTLDTAAMLMRGISEEEQIAMAIAASLDADGGSGGNATSPSVTADRQTIQQSRSSSDDDDDNLFGSYDDGDDDDDDNDEGAGRGQQRSPNNLMNNPSALLRSFSTELSQSRRAMIEAMQTSRRAVVDAVNSTRRAMATEATHMGGGNNNGRNSENLVERFVSNLSPSTSTNGIDQRHQHVSNLPVNTVIPSLHSAPNLSNTEEFQTGSLEESNESAEVNNHFETNGNGTTGTDSMIECIEKCSNNESLSTQRSQSPTIHTELPRDVGSCGGNITEL